MISFDKSIYLKDAVIRACTDYMELANIKIKEQDGRIFCEMKNAKANPELITDEFSNYVLNLTVMMGGAKR